MRVAVSGIRDLGPAWYAEVELAVLEQAAVASELVFGGALGTDTVALAACCLATVPRRVVVPFTVREQPAAAARVIQACATDVDELRLAHRPSSYLRRNDRMLAGAQRLLAFTDGRTTGGTAYTIRKAHALGLQVVVVGVGTTKILNPGLAGFSAPVHAVAPYVSARGGTIDPTSETLRRLKLGRHAPAQLAAVAERVARYVAVRPDFKNVDAIVPVPRRDPSMPQDLHELAEALSLRLGVPVVEGLVREEAPTGGVARLFRLRFSPEEHARTLRADLPARIRRPLLLDNVITTGGTMEGAILAVKRDTAASPVGLGILYSAQAGLDTVAA